MLFEPLVRMIPHHMGMASHGVPMDSGFDRSHMGFRRMSLVCCQLSDDTTDHFKMRTMYKTVHGSFCQMFAVCSIENDLQSVDTSTVFSADVSCIYAAGSHLEAIWTTPRDSTWPKDQSIPFHREEVGVRITTRGCAGPLEE